MNEINQKNKSVTEYFDLRYPVFKSTNDKEIQNFSSNALSKANNKNNNPLVCNVFGADPTSVVYNGRIYVYGTCDHRQYREKSDSQNTYELIKSFVILSTDDMANWKYEGEIKTDAIAPWIQASWAPSVISRKESDGLTHFYLYFSNSGSGVGVITSTDPLGPWNDPLGRPLVECKTEGLEDCPTPFDPGVCIDENGTGWLSFGGGKASNGTNHYPGVSRIVRLGEDLISLDSKFAKIPAPYFYEASELNYINHTYVYTFNTSWEERKEWDKSKNGDLLPTRCSMAYMTTETPLDEESWQYRGHYLKNPGDLGMYDSNNHTHVDKYNDSYYIFYHTLLSERAMNIELGYRSICADKIEIDEQTLTFSECHASPSGAEQLKCFDPYRLNHASISWISDVAYSENAGNIVAECAKNGVIALRGVDFGSGSKNFVAEVCGKGRIDVRLDSFEGRKICGVSFDCDEYITVYNDEAVADGVHDLYFILEGSFKIDRWGFEK